MWLIWSGAGIFLVVFIAAVLWVEHSLSVDGQRLRTLIPVSQVHKTQSRCLPTEARDPRSTLF
jgi:hypothetical protein